MQTTDINNSAQSQVDIPQDLRYYVVSMTWFRKAAPVLQYIRDALSMQNQHHSTTASTISGSIQPPVSSFNTLTWKEDIGIIQNSFLTTATPTIVSETTRKPPPPFLDELQKKSSLPVSSSMSTAAASPAESSSALASSSSSLGVQPQYRHSIDYVLVGANVWLLLSQKFGFDVVLSVPCLYTRRRPSFDDPSREQLSYLSVRVNNATTISSSSRQQQPCVPIPIKCRFPYEQYLSAAAAAAPLKQLHTADQVASDDDFDDLVRKNQHFLLTDHCAVWFLK